MTRNPDSNYEPFGSNAANSSVVIHATGSFDERAQTTVAVIP